MECDCNNEEVSVTDLPESKGEVCKDFDTKSGEMGESGPGASGTGGAGLLSGGKKHSVKHPQKHSQRREMEDIDTPNKIKIDSINESKINDMISNMSIYKN